jgi:methyl-accepting chemotaxis protein
VQLRRKASEMAQVSTTIRSPVTKAGRVKTSGAGGFAFDMGSDDEHDAEFKRAS